VAGSSSAGYNACPVLSRTSLYNVSNDWRTGQDETANNYMIEITV
jgi:hypothetical protein